jgi:xylulokinase
MESKKRLALGLDISTQSISAVVLDIDAREIVCEMSLDYNQDPRLNIYGLRKEDYLLPPESEGEASQPAMMFFAALDAIFTELRNEIDMGALVAVNTSGQQHGHIYLNSNADPLFSSLNKENTVKSTLADLFEDGLAYDRAPIWMTADTQNQSEYIRSAVGGKEKLIQLSGSDAPFRFTGVVMRKIGERHPDVYRRTATVQLISSLTASIMTGNARAPLDFGNGCGTSLMDYRRKKWSDVLMKAASDGLPGGEKAFAAKLPAIVPPYEVVGQPAAYFVKKYGFSSDCRILAGSGDNPQAKVCVSGDLLSLGSSIVNMVETDGKTFDLAGYANAMYDGLGRPFMFGCRTNGALVWDQVRSKYGLKKDDFRMAEDTLHKVSIGQNLVFWQPRAESFPVSPAVELTRHTGNPGFDTDYPGIVESTLVAVYYHSLGFSRTSQEPLYVTGGAQNSPGILRRVAALWQRPVIGIEEGGAALGAAVAAAGIFLNAVSPAKTGADTMTGYPGGLLKSQKAVEPLPDDVKAFHGKGGYLEKFAQAEAKMILKQK